MPLADMVVTRSDVNDFWEKQEWDLSLPQDTSLSNCVYCFLKGALNLRDIHARMEQQNETAEGFGPLAETPSDLAWWNRVKSQYSRDLEAEGRPIRGSATRIGLFGNHGFTYENLQEDTDMGPFAGTMLPCDFTE